MPFWPKKRASDKTECLSIPFNFPPGGLVATANFHINHAGDDESPQGLQLGNSRIVPQLFCPCSSV